MDDPEQDAVASLYREFLDQRNSGRDPSITEFLGRCPQEQRDELREAIDFLRQSKAQEAAPVRKFGDFEIVREIGRGGMGVVYEARQVSIQRPVALKLLSPWAAQEPSARARLIQEALALAKVQHPNIVSVLAAGEEQETPYLAMELVAGRSLSEAMEESRGNGQPIPISQIIRWIWRIACGLESAHAAGIVHRDVKPQNIRITHDGRALLLDFGLARDAQAASLTKTGSFQGSPFYASPEQVAAKGVPITGLTDVYSLGVTLYECATGVVPFQGETSEQILQQILLREPTPPRQVNRAISRDLEIVILKAIEKNPSHRYASAAAFAADLEALLELRPIAARPSGATTKALKWASRNPGGALAVASALLGALAVLSIWQGQRIRRDRERENFLKESWAAAEKGEFEQALSAADKAIGLAPEDLESLNLRRLVLEKRDRQLSSEEVKKARAHLESYRRLRDLCRQESKKLQDFQGNLTSRRMTEEEMSAGEALERTLPRLQKERDSEQRAIESTLAAAIRLHPGNPEIGGVRAEFFMEEWREAARNGDSLSEDHFLKLVEANDPTGNFREELLGLGEIGIEIFPPDAEAFLFRFQDLSEIREAGERRMVPVPVQDGPVPPEVGMSALRVVKDQGGYQAGDLIFESQSHGTRRTRVLRMGSWLALEAAGDLELRPTVAPLLASPANRLGPSPIKLESMKPGSYLVWARKAGFESQRVSIHLPRKGAVTRKIQLLLKENSPPGFVFVPGGVATATLQGSTISADVDPFWIQETELSAAEYLGFLNDPTTLKEIDSSTVPIRFPRNSRDPMLQTLPDHGASLWIRNPNGLFELPPEYSKLPVVGISYEDAGAFVRWRNERAARLGEPWIFSLPDRKEWYFAGSGTDGRGLPFGNRFNPRWTANQISLLAARPTASLQFPADESPFAVYDLGGNLAEFVWEGGADGKPVAFIAGGSWIVPGALLSNLLPINQESYGAPFNFAGIRLVAKSTK